VPEGPSSEDVAKALARHGFNLVHQRGSHAKFVRDKSPARVVIVPMGRKNLKIGPFRSICRKPDFNPETSDPWRSSTRLGR
jgi:predicted RNA binding protein YcfA (HicA-like mRNA interferase family)